MSENSEKSEFPDSHRFSLTLHTNYNNKSANGTRFDFRNMQCGKVEKREKKCQQLPTGCRIAREASQCKECNKDKMQIWETFISLAPELSTSCMGDDDNRKARRVLSVNIIPVVGMNVIWCICGASTGAKWERGMIAIYIMEKDINLSTMEICTAKHTNIHTHTWETWKH